MREERGASCSENVGNSEWMFVSAQRCHDDFHDDFHDPVSTVMNTQRYQSSIPLTFVLIKCSQNFQGRFKEAETRARQTCHVITSMENISHYLENRSHVGIRLA